jgi:(p)ppGpp synthase/HD superfamily hydrolase
VNENPRFRAIEFAVRAHHGQFRKGTRIPYVVHPIAVGRRLMELGYSEPLVLAGFLHDVVEDAGVDKDEIERLFGRKVVDLIEAVSEGDKSLPWERRKRAKLERLEGATQEVLVLSLADQLDNLRSIQRALAWEGGRVWSRFNRPRAQQAWYFGRLVDLYDRRVANGPARSLAEAFHESFIQVFPTESRDSPHDLA